MRWPPSDRVVGLRAGVRLDVDPFGAEKLLGAVARELLDLVDGPAAAVEAAAGIALGVLVGEDGADGLHHGEGHEVLGGDELDAVALTAQLVVDDLGDLGVGLVQVVEVHAVPSRVACRCRRDDAHCT